MYERSVIVLEKYMEEILGLSKQNNLKNNFYTYKEMVEEMKVFQDMLAEEEKVLGNFEEIARKVQNLQEEEELLYKNNVTIEEARYAAFRDLGTNPEELNKKISRMEKQVEKNNKDLKEIRNKYISTLKIFLERQKERNACARKKKSTDTNHIITVRKTKQLFDMIDKEDLKRMKNFVDGDKRLIKDQICGIMLENGKNEKVPFNEHVIKNAIEVRMEIANDEAKCYIIIYDKLRKLLADIDNDQIPLNRYEKTLKDVSVKLKFLDAEKEYIVGFLDNERVTAMSGEIVHEKMMQDACDEFRDDICQINNLYSLIKKEAAGRATNKAYAELLNTNYLREIEEGGKNFEKELTNININAGTILNSNYWRIEGLKNVYTVFKDEVSKKYSRDLSAYMYEEKDKNLLGKSNKIELKNNKKEDIKFNFDDLSKYEKEDKEDKDDFFNLDDLGKYESDEDIDLDDLGKYEEEELNETQTKSNTKSSFEPEIIQYDDLFEERHNNILDSINKNEEKNNVIDAFNKEEDEDLFEENETQIEPEIVEDTIEDNYDDNYEEYTKGYEEEYNKKMQEIEEAKKQRKTNISISRPKISGVKEHTEQTQQPKRKIQLRPQMHTQQAQQQQQQTPQPQQTKQIRDIKIKIKNRRPSGVSVTSQTQQQQRIIQDIPVKNMSMNKKGLKIKKPTVAKSGSQSQRIDEFMRNTNQQNSKTPGIFNKLFNKNNKVAKTS